jgi:rhodanese-related sulfurtransferase
LRARLRETAQAFTLVDVRDPQEFNSGHLPGARNIPVNDLESRLQEVVQYENVVFVCLSGKRSQAACVIALRGGLRAPGHLEGGMLAWREVTGDG